MRSARLATVTVLVALAFASSAQAQEVVEYYGTDALGSVRVVFDATGAVVARADYLPYGEELAAAGPMPSEHFTGQARDGEAGMDYFHARQYQPRTGRFNAVDPIPPRP
jgi:RHS repeat-associated protein